MKEKHTIGSFLPFTLAKWEEASLMLAVEWCISIGVDFNSFFLIKVQVNIGYKDFLEKKLSM